MITLLQEPRRWGDGTYNIEFAGLSADSKPVSEYERMKIANCSSFFEIDTAEIYFYDKETEEWKEP